MSETVVDELIQSPSRDAQVTAAAWLYYEAGQTQQVIADRLGVSRPTVVRLLAEARDTGVIEIRFMASLPGSLRSSFELEEAFAGTSVSRVVVADGEGKRMAARSAGLHLAQVLTHRDVLGVGWSTTLGFVGGSVPPDTPPARIVQLVGSLGQFGDGGDGYEIAVRLGREWGVGVSSLPVPVMLAEAATAAGLRSDPVVRDTTAWFERVTVALVGLGSVSPDSTMVDTGYLTPEDLAAVGASGGAGEILGRYVDTDGNAVIADWDDRMIGATLDDLRPVDNVIAVAAGPAKLLAAIGAVRSGVVNTLVVDSALAAVLQRTVLGGGM